MEIMLKMMRGLRMSHENDDFNDFMSQRDGSRWSDDYEYRLLYWVKRLGRDGKGTIGNLASRMRDDDPEGKLTATLIDLHERGLVRVTSSGKVYRGKRVYLWSSAA